MIFTVCCGLLTVSSFVSESVLMNEGIYAIQKNSGQNNADQSHTTLTDPNMHKYNQNRSQFGF